MCCCTLNGIIVDSCHSWWLVNFLILCWPLSCCNSPHQEGQVAGSAALGTSTDFELWLKGHFSRVAAGGYGGSDGRLYDFRMVFSDHEAILLLLCSRNNNMHSRLRHQERFNCSLLVLWGERCGTEYCATTLENITVL